MSSTIKVVTSPFVDVLVTSTVTSFHSEKRFQKSLTIAELKNKLELLTGADARYMVLEVYNKNDELVCTPNDNNSVLGSYPVDSGMRIHVIDKSRKPGEFEDLSKVEKYEIPEEEYEKRADSLRAFKQRMKLGQFKELDPEEEKRLEEEKKKKEEEEQKRIASMKVGNRCEVTIQGQPVKRGTIMYIGSTAFKPGIWIGVKYDEPLGKNDGSVQGKQYFTCPPKYGAFVRPGQVTVGDFPEIGIDDLDEM